MANAAAVATAAFYIQNKSSKYAGLEARGQADNIRISFTTPTGHRVRVSTGTTDWDEAAELRDRLKADAWRQARLGDRPRYLWQEAVLRWLTEQTGQKRTLAHDKQHLRFAARLLDNMALDAITPDTIQSIAQGRLESGCSVSTVNRMLEVIRAILKRAEKDWRWLDSAPAVRLLRTPKRRVRWLTDDEATRLLAELPPHLAAMARFTLATGLRASNVTGLRWSQINLAQRRAWIHQDEFKGETRALAVPLNTDAVAILRQQVSPHRDYVFVYKGGSRDTAQ